MKLVKCYVSSFGKLKDFSFDFNEGLNTIKQDNGWGKSTLATFIKVMFYGINSNKRSVSENDRIKYRPWNSTEKFGGAVWFIWGDKEYKIERFFGQKESDDTVALFDVATGKSFANTENLGKRIFEIDEEGFLSTTYLSQREFEIKSNSSITAKFNSLCELQDSDSFDKAVDKIESQAKKYKYRGDKGLISDLKKQVYLLDEEILRTNNAVLTCQHLKNEIDILEKETQAYQNKTKELTDKVELAGKIEALINKKNRYVKLNEKREELIKNKQYAEQVFNGKTISESEINDSQNALFELKSLEERKNQLQSDVKNLQDVNANNITKDSNVLSIVLYSLMAVSFLVGVILLFTVGFSFLPAWLAVGVSGLILIFSLTKAFTLNKRKINSKQILIDEKNREITLLESNFNVINDKLSSFVSQFDFGESLPYDKAIDYLLKIYSAYQKVCFELNAINEEFFELEKEKNEFVLIDNNQQNLQGLNALLREVQNEFSKKSYELANARTKLRINEEVASNFNELEGRKEELLEEVKQAEEEYNILTLTYQYLIKADENLKIKYREPLQNSLKKYYDYISDVQKEIKIDIDLGVSIEENGSEKSIEYYSKGYQNLFEICKRFALTDVLFTGEKPFIILDDPFYNLDDKKLKSALKLIEKLSNDYQIIYLVCHDSRVA